MGFLSKFFGGNKETDSLSTNASLNTAELAKRLDIAENELFNFSIKYNEFTIPKRSGGTRRILAPSNQLKHLQRQLNRRILKRLKSHPAVTGFEQGHSIATNALFHMGRAVVIRMDIQDFFTKTSYTRINKYFRKIGWDKKAAMLLSDLCTYESGLPQGAPTSPRLSNLVNYQLDARLQGLANKSGGVYTRYADDLTFSFDDDSNHRANEIVNAVKRIIESYGYKLHMKKKLSIRRRHQSQRVTGLVVNEGVNLPRETRRWLRAVEHRLRTGGKATLTESQLAGWKSLLQMIKQQAR